jgi:hypothetical protein
MMKKSERGLTGQGARNLEVLELRKKARHSKE